MATSKHQIATVTGPSGLPRLASELFKMAAPGGAIESVEAQIGIMGMDGGPGFGPNELAGALELKIALGAQMARWYQHVAAEGELWWVSSDMTDLICDAASSIPEDTVLTDELVLHREGLVVFDRPIIGMGVKAGERVRVDGIMWGTTNLPPLPDRPEGTPCISMVAFTRVGPGFIYPDGQPSDIMVGHELWAPLGRSDWPVGYELSKVPMHSDLAGWTVEREESMMEDRALMAALWTVARTHTVADTTEERPNRPERRRLQRDGAVRADAAVRVIHLRREVPRTDHGQETLEPGRSRLRHRFVVRAHLRNQACGPGMKDHRLILVPPYIKGPEGAPLLRTPRVWSLDR